MEIIKSPSEIKAEIDKANKGDKLVTICNKYGHSDKKERVLKNYACPCCNSTNLVKNFDYTDTVRSGKHVYKLTLSEYRCKDCLALFNSDYYDIIDSTFNLEATVSGMVFIIYGIMFWVWVCGASGYMISINKGYLWVYISWAIILIVGAIAVEFCGWVSKYFLKDIDEDRANTIKEELTRSKKYINY